MNAGTYQVNISYRLNLASLRRLNTELTNIARRFRVIPVSIKVSGNITAVKSQLSDMKKRYRTISSRVNITSNINTINSQLNKLKNRKITVPINYTGNGSTPRAYSPTVNSPISNRRSYSNDPDRGRTIGGRIGRGIASRGIYEVGTQIGAIPLTAVQTAASYEEVMIDIKSTLEALGDGSPKQIKEMDKLIKEIGLTTRFTSTEAAQAAQMLIRNGVSAKGILEGMLQSTVNTSIVMRSDLSTTADLMTDVMAFYRDMGVSAEEASDKIVAGTLTSKFGLNDMYHALANSGTEASAYGVKLEELTAVISLISPAFKSGRKAGTSFKYLLKSLTGRSDKARAKMKELGLEFTDGLGNFKSTRDIIKELIDVFGEMTPKVRAAMVNQTMYGESINAVNGLIREGIAGYDAMIAKQGDMDTAELARKKSNNGLIMAYKNLTSAVDGLYKVIVNQSVLDWMSHFTKDMTESVRWVSKFIESLNLANNKYLQIVGNVGKHMLAGPLTKARKLIEGVNNSDAYLDAREYLDKKGILSYTPPEPPTKIITPAEAYKQYSANRTIPTAMLFDKKNKGMKEPEKKSNKLLEQYLENRSLMGKTVIPVVVKPNPSSNNTYMDYLDKDQRQLLKPPVSSSVTNSSKNGTVILNKGAVQVNGADVSEPHATGKEVNRSVEKVFKTDSDGFLVLGLDFNG